MPDQQHYEYLAERFLLELKTLLGNAGVRVRACELEWEQRQIQWTVDLAASQFEAAAAHARETSRLHSQALVQVMAETERLAYVHGAFRAVMDRQAKNFETAKKGLANQEMRPKLRTAFVGAGLADAEVERALATIEGYDHHAERARMKTKVDEAEHLFNKAFLGHLRLYMFGHHAQLLSRNNLIDIAMRHDIGVVGGTAVDAVAAVKAAARALEGVKNLLVMAQRLLAASKWQRLNALLDTMRAHLDTIERSPLLGHAALFRRAHDLLLLRGRSDVVLARANVMLGRVMRFLVFARAALYFLRFISAQQRKTALGTHEVNSARKLPFIAAPAPRRVAMADLLANPAAQDGATIEIEAVVERITIVHVHRKAISRVALRGFDGSAGVEAALPYIKVNSSGLSATAPARLRGQWKATNAELEGRPGLQIDRLDLGELARRSWLHHLVAGVRPAFELYHLGIDIDAALTPGPRGSAKELTFLVARTARK